MLDDVRIVLCRANSVGELLTADIQLAVHEILDVVAFGQFLMINGYLGQIQRVLIVMVDANFIFKYQNHFLVKEILPLNLLVQNRHVHISF